MEMSIKPFTLSSDLIQKVAHMNKNKNENKC